MADRAHLLNDAFSLSEVGRLPYSVPLAMTAFLRRDSDLLPWATAYDKIVRLQDMLVGTQAFPLLRKVSKRDFLFCRLVRATVQ